MSDEQRIKFLFAIDGLLSGDLSIEKIAEQLNCSLSMVQERAALKFEAAKSMKKVEETWEKLSSEYREL